uniref:securin-like n=1 Tax=Myxine glutinosa TaxID=7769 RepID=UPI00358FE3D1
MSDLHLIGTENLYPATPLPRSRLGSIPGSTHKTPWRTKSTLPVSSRPALVSVNVDRLATPASKLATPASKLATPASKLATPASKLPNIAPNKFVEPGKVPSLARVKEDEWPDIEKFIPWDPLEAEIVGVPEEHSFGDLLLAGLPRFPLPQFEISTPSVSSLPSPEPLPSYMRFDCVELPELEFPSFADVPMPPPLEI